MRSDRLRTVAPAALAGVMFAAPAKAQQQAGEMTLDVEEAAEQFQTRGYSHFKLCRPDDCLVSQTTEWPWAPWWSSTKATLRSCRSCRSSVGI